MNKDPRDIILKPVVSEKSYGLIDEGKYTFLVDPRATKTEIKLAIEKIFGVKVAAVNTINRVGKSRAHPLRHRQAQGHQARHRDPASSGTIDIFTASRLTVGIGGHRTPWQFASTSPRPRVAAARRWLGLR